MLVSFVLGQNLTVEFRAYGPHFDLIPQYAMELVKARVDVITVSGDETVRAVQQATKTIPIVALTDDLFASGFVNLLERPDGNTTGVNILAREGDGKRQDILIEAVPGLRRMAVLTDVNDAIPARLDALQEAGRAHRIEFSIHRVARGYRRPGCHGRVGRSVGALFLHRTDHDAVRRRQNHPPNSGNS